MKKIRFRFWLMLFIFSFGEVAAQRCIHDIRYYEEKLNNPELYQQREAFKMKVNKLLEGKSQFKLNATEEIYVIPVVVHIIHNNSSGTIGGTNNPNISDAQVLSQIQVLNEDYRRMAGTNGYNTDPLGADCKIEFCLATLSPSGEITNGIVRVYHSKPSWDDSEEIQLKSLSYWPSDQYLNIWVCRLSNGILGYAPYPGGSAALDGVVVDFRAFGNTGAVVSPYNLGRTATHEVGHWLGLIHLWGDDPFSGCQTDFVADTPDDDEPNLDLDCIDSSDCDNNGIYIQDLTHDYMDYSTDICMNMFTSGQKDRMRTVMTTDSRRAALKNSPGCCVSGSLYNIPLQEGFESDDYLSNGWSIYDPDPNTTWERTSPGAYDLSAASLYMDNDGANLGEQDFLVTPFIRFSGLEPFLEFDLAYAADPFVNTSDTLTISYNLNCKDWFPIATFYGSDLLTTTDSTTTFTPAENEWRRIKIDLDPLDNKAVGRLRFENRSGTRSNLYLDNINIYKTSGDLEVHIYPNPTTNVMNLEVIFSGEQDVTYEMYDLIGQKVFQLTERNKISHIKSFDVSGITRGMYIVKVSIKGQSVTQKVLINY